MTTSSFVPVPSHLGVAIPLIIVSLQGTAPPLVSSLMCCSTFVKSHIIKSFFHQVLTETWTDTGAFQLMYCQLPITLWAYHLWGSSAEVWHQRFELVFIKGLPSLTVSPDSMSYGSPKT